VLSMRTCQAVVLFAWLACARGVEIPWDGDSAEDGQPLVPKLDWDAFIDAGETAKLKVTGATDLERELNVGGAATFASSLQAKGKAIFEGDAEIRGRTLTHGGHEFVLGTQDGEKQLSKKTNRALMHHSSPVDSLHLNFDGDFEGGVVVGGPTTTISGDLVGKGSITAEQDLVVQGSSFILGKGDGKKQGSGKNRAIAHSDDDRLILNEEGDFEGGVNVQGPGLFTEGKLGIGKGNVQPEADIHIKTAEEEAVLLFSHDTKSKNSLFVKGVAGSGGGIDMEIGSSAGSESYGRLKVDFAGDINFEGGGLTTFKRGNTVFAKGTVGVGENAVGGSHGITVEGGEKAGHSSNDVALKRGSLHFFGGLYDTSSKGKWYLDLDKGAHVKAMNIAAGLGIGTEVPKSAFGDTAKAFLHMVDKGRPVITLESQTDTGHATIVMKTGKAEWTMDQASTVLKFSSGAKDMLVLDNKGKVGIGRANNEPYGMNIHVGEGENNPLNDLALPHGNIRLKGKIFDTFDGGDKYFLDPSSTSNIKDLGLEGKLSFKGVQQPPMFHVDVPKGDAHISVGRSLFLNGNGGEGARVTNNAVIDAKGGYSLHDATKLASAIELRNTGQIEFMATKQAGKMVWEPLLGMDGIKGAVYAHGKFGVGMKDPQHTFHMPGEENTMSLGNNLFLAGAGGVNRITANAYLKDKSWVIERRDRFASSIELKDSGAVDMYGTETQGAVQWKKMFGYNTPKKVVYAFGKFGIETESPTHTLTLPSGEHHISLGDKLFLNGEGGTSRVMGNCYMQRGKLAIQDKTRQAVSVELDSAGGKLTFAGTQSRGSDAFLKLLSADFTNKAVVIESGRLGIKTTAPKSSVDVRGHVYLQDPANAGVIYTSSSGPGLFFRSADVPGTYKSDHERYFFGNNHRVGFGTTQPEGKLHIVHTGDDARVPHIKLETAGVLQFDIAGTKDGLNFQTIKDGQSFNFKAGDAKPLSVYGKASEATVNEVKFKESTVLLVPDGGRAAIGGAPKGQHNLQVFGAGLLVTGGKGPNKGVIGFANDGGGQGFQMDYEKGIMSFGGLPPMVHLKNSGRANVHMAILDSGRVGIGTKQPSSALSIKSDTGITVENSAGAKWTYKTTADGNLEFESNKGGFFKVDNQGGMHLSRKQSKYKLEVDGTGMLLTGDSKGGKAPLVFHPDGGGKGFQMDYYKEKMMFGHGDGGKWHMTMSDAGLMGVGTPSPESAVHIKHDSGIDIEHGTKVEKWNLATTEDATLGFSYKGRPRVSFSKEGFVGIGTDKPTKTLHVAGDVFVSGKMHVDNNYLKKMAAKLAAPASPAPELNELMSTEALIQLDEHVSAKMEENSYGMVHRKDSERAAEPVDYASLMTIMHKVVQDHQTEIKLLRDRVAALEKKL